MPDPYRPSTPVTVLYFLCSPFTAATVASFAGGDLLDAVRLFLVFLAVLGFGYRWVRQSEMRTTLATLIVTVMAVPSFFSIIELLS
ncbi:hypothetical protein JRI60_35955 [Archangium violaceum]|uniref:hypothetical protein n=1 Tax=Archangium violaceum TaxID=83451 RepID=UPI001950C1AA|nr:hypothetical protein [Archangium violaceum]QRN94489.1 hypothetical protein JRI60_35955 [Archangium violaceum]